ncbi:MAG TPA: hypothetical protein EYP78_05165 [Candidatus Omnitrophica bacterium]|nr:hypothetical protein [Candidatus Omnitrophota bacterium]
MRKSYLPVLCVLLAFSVTICFASPGRERKFGNKQQLLEKVAEEYPELSDEVEAIKAKCAELKALREEWHQRLKETILARHKQRREECRRKLEARLAELKEEYPEKYEELKAKIEKRKAAIEEAWESMTPEERKAKREEFLARLKEKHPEQYEKIIAKIEERRAEKEAWKNMSPDERLAKLKETNLELYQIRVKIEKAREELKSLTQDLRQQLKIIKTEEEER